MKNRIILLSAFVAFVFFMNACSSGQTDSGNSSEEIIPVKVIALEEGASHLSISVSGLFTTDDETVLSFKTGGVINRLYVKQGDRIVKGQLLATLNLTEVEAGTSQAKFARDKAMRDYQRASNLYKDSVATLEQLQNAKTALDIATQQLKTASFNRSYSEIHATKDGFVLQKMANEGQVVAPGTPVLQVNGAGDTSWQLKVGVSDGQWAQIKIGDRAVIQTDAIPDESLEAYVFKKAEGIDPSSGTFDVYLKLKKPLSVKLATGVFARAVIYPKESPRDGWTVPYDAVLDGDAGKGFVFVTNDGKKAIKQEVQIASINKQYIILSGGLENVKYLIVSGSPYLDNGSLIKIQGEK